MRSRWSHAFLGLGVAIGLALMFMLGFAPAVPAQAQPARSVTLTFGPGRDMTQPGTVTLTAIGSRPSTQTMVVINVTPASAGISQPAHIHMGMCPNVGKVVYPLTNVVDGMSTTTVNAGFSTLFNGQFAVNIHQSTTNAGVYTACVNIPHCAGMHLTSTGCVALAQSGARTTPSTTTAPAAAPSPATSSPPATTALPPAPTPAAAASTPALVAPTTAAPASAVTAAPVPAAAAPAVMPVPSSLPNTGVGPGPDSSAFIPDAAATIMPATGSASDQFTLTATGFNRGDNVSLTLYDGAGQSWSYTPSSALPSLVVGDDGTVSVNLTPAIDLSGDAFTTGYWTAVFTDQTTGAIVSIQFVVTV